MVQTRHYEIDRKEREELIQKIGIGKPIIRFKWDRGHKDGPEIHVITDTAMILIYNAITGRHCTTLIARPGQIKRYFDKIGKKAPLYLLDLAYEHQRMGYNNR